MIYLGTDHGGFEFKEKIKQWLKDEGREFEDMGAYKLDPNDDYPDFVIPVARKVVENPGSLGIILGRSGNGEAITANKVRGARAAVCLNAEMARKAKDHNNANILSLGGDYIKESEVKEIINAFLDTPFSNDERHLRRHKKDQQLENESV